MNHIPPSLQAMLSEQMLQALDDLDHNCDLIACRPLPCEVRWTLERAGLPIDLCALVGSDRSTPREPETLDLFA